MKLQQELQLRLSTCNLKDICHLMGYKDDRSVTRVRDVVTDPCLGLFKGGYDLKFNDAEFLSKLCSVLGIDINEFKAELDAIHAEHDDRRDRFKSYVFVDTGFKRTTQPIFALAGLSWQRYIRLEYEVRVQPLSEQVVYVQRLIKSHYEKQNGQLGIWGDIKKYLFVYAEGEQLEISPDGIILGESDTSPIDEPSLTVGNTEITFVISDINSMKEG